MCYTEHHVFYFLKLGGNRLAVGWGGHALSLPSIFGSSGMWQKVWRQSYYTIHIVQGSCWLRCGFLLIYLYIDGQCILGDPRGEHIVIREKTSIELLSKEAMCSTPRALALSLLSWLFTKEQLAEGICNPQPATSPAASRVLLNQEWINGIRCKFTEVVVYNIILLSHWINLVHINYRYPDSPENMTKRWSEIVKKALNTKCRNIRNAQKSNVDEGDSI